MFKNASKITENRFQFCLQIVINNNLSFALGIKINCVRNNKTLKFFQKIHSSLIHYSVLRSRRTHLGNILRSL